MENGYGGQVWILYFHNSPPACDHVMSSDQRFCDFVAFSLQLPYCTQTQILISNLTHGGSQDNKTFTVVWDDILVLIVPNLVAPESKPSLECLIRHTDIHIGISINKN